MERIHKLNNSFPKASFVIVIVTGFAIEMRVHPIKKHADSIRIQPCFCTQNDGFVSLSKEERFSLAQC